jgi:hypothetical protein
VEVQGGDLAASYGMLCVTKEGYRQLEAAQERPQRPHLAFRGSEALEKKGAPRRLNTDENPAA